MTISLAFLAPDLIKAAVEGRLPRGIGVERLRDAPAEWGRQFETLGLNPQWGWKRPDSQALFCRLKSSRRERNFQVQRPEAKSRRERLLTCAETGKPHRRQRISPQNRHVSERRRFRRFGNPSMSTRCSPAELRALKP